MADIEKDSDYIDLRDFIRAVWEYKIFVIIFTFSFLVMSVLLALYTPNKYQSTVVLSPLVENASSTSRLGSRFGGFTTFAGIFTS